MRAVLQRVINANVKVKGEIIASITHGFLIFLGIDKNDTEEDAQWLIRKIVNMRIFNDEFGKMNLSIKETNGSALIISQFTLHASTKKGNRPSFIKAANPEKAFHMYDSFCRDIGILIPIKCGVFGAHMKISLLNDGPVTILIDSKKKE